jgi:hypothetical protein
MMSRYTVHELVGLGILNEIVHEISAGGAGDCGSLAIHFVKG